MAILQKIDMASLGRIFSFFGVFVGIVAGLALGLVLGGVYESLFLGVLGFVAGLAISIILAWIYGVVMAWLYNFAAEVVGGVRLNLSSRRGGSKVCMTRIDVVSYARIGAMTVATIVFGLAAIFVSVNAALRFVAVGIIASVGIVVLITAISAVVGFVATALGAVLYNFAAERVGGIRFNLSNNAGSYNKILSSVDYMSYAKVYVVIIAIWGLIVLVVKLFAIGVFGSRTWMLHPGLGAAVTIIGSIVGFVFSIIFGFVIALLVGIIYNVGAKRIGGVELRFKQLK